MKQVVATLALFLMTATFAKAENGLSRVELFDLQARCQSLAHDFENRHKSFLTYDAIDWHYSPKYGKCYIRVLSGKLYGLYDAQHDEEMIAWIDYSDKPEKMGWREALITEDGKIDWYTRAAAWAYINSRMSD